MFQSTRPVRGATAAAGVHTRGSDVSIHAPRAGRDLLRTESRYSHPLFQSTRPVRGATISPI
ncbi:hypothetical protein HMPREF9162_2205 [Selenomonas sp. oral taxon 137 str. F0430]|nr:hypothetical protein HMPREF9162_2205 [Selenomonas sp. oral taxon 137 str. F0430]